MWNMDPQQIILQSKRMVLAVRYRRICRLSQKLVELITSFRELDYMLACKLKAVKTKLKEWSKSYQGNFSAQKRTLLGQMVELEEILDNRPLKKEKMRKAALLMEYEDFVKNEEISRRPRSRTLAQRRQE